MPAYRIEGLTKVFARGKQEPPCRALDNVGFSIQPGEFLVVLGPNGAGKTTLLRALAGLEAPTTGDVRVDGQSLVRVPPHRRDIAMVFQNFSLYPRFTVQENLEMSLRSGAAKLSEAEIGARITETAGFLGILDKLGRLPGGLSGGEMQRVAIGRALVRRPNLFLLDEPLTHLDAQMRERMRVEIRLLQRRLGVATLYVTQDHEEAMGLADRVLVLDQGRLQQTGHPEEIYRRPRNSRVARMLGRPPVNLIPAEKAAALGIPPGKGRVVGIRPESFRVTASENGGALVKAVEHLGPVSVLLVEAEGLLLRALAPPTTRARLGQRVLLAVNPEDVKWFEE
jgi:multiple sugar transport system ATP-binding protein